jgi:hypothetical protein
VTAILIFLALAGGFTLGVLVAGIIASGKDDDAFRAGYSAGKAQCEHERP